MLHINLEILPNSPREYDENDRPKFGADEGPYCGTLPSPSFTQETPLTDVPDFEDGVTRDTGKGTKREATGGDEFGVTLGSAVEAELVRGLMVRQEERRVGKEGVGRCSSRGRRYNDKK